MTDDLHPYPVCQLCESGDVRATHGELCESHWNDWQDSLAQDAMAEQMAQEFDATGQIATTDEF